MIDKYLLNHYQNLKIKISYEPNILDTGGGIKNAINFFKEKKILVLNSDVFWHNSNAIDLKKLLIEHEMLEQAGVMGFFLGAVRQFVIQCKCQQMPDKVSEIQREEWLTQMLTMWIISQQPGEYNTMHIHTQCQISTVMYLKVPKMLPSRKEHRSTDDGSILFVNNSSRDIDFSVPNIVIPPQVGDFFIFGAQQQHAVYPYRCEEGDPERRSISFNAVFQSKTDHDRGKKVEIDNAVVKPGESRPS